MTVNQTIQTVYPETTARSAASTMKWLYWIGAATALIAAVLFRRNISAEVSLLTGQIAPDSAGDWFRLLQQDRLTGLVTLNLFDLVNYALVGVILLAVYAILRQVNPGIMLLAICTGVAGVVLYFSANQSLSMLSLASQYTAATTDSERTVFLAAGESLLAIHRSGAGVYLSLLFVTLSGLMMSVVMLQSTPFNKATAYTGILAHSLILCYFPALILAPSLTFIPHSAGAVPLLIWQLLIAWRLFKLGRRDPPTSGD